MAPLELLRRVGGHHDGYSPKNKRTRCRSLRDFAMQVDQDVEFLVVGFVSLKVLIPINWLINPRIFM